MAIIDSVKIPNENENRSLRDNNVYSLLADEYSNNTIYNIGDCCIYEYKLYKCNTTINSPEPFDSTKWDITTIMAEIKGI